MNIRHILLVICILIPFVAQAGFTRPGNYSHKMYWVVGSFVMKDRAINEAKRIQKSTGFEVKLLPSNVRGEAHFRIVVEISATDAERKLQKQAFEDAGVVGAWALHPHVLDSYLIAIDGSTPHKAPAVMVAPAKTPAKPAPQAEPAQPTAEELLAMELKTSYLNFCMYKATPSQRTQYCNNRDFAINNPKQPVPEAYRALVEFCSSRATPSERAAMCNNVSFESTSKTPG